MEARPGGWGKGAGTAGGTASQAPSKGPAIAVVFSSVFSLVFLSAFFFFLSFLFFFFPPIFSAFNSTKAETVAVSEVSRQGPRGWVHQPWAHPSSPSPALPVPGPLEHLSAYARRAVPIHCRATTLDVRIVSRAGWGLAARPWLSSTTLLMPCVFPKKTPQPVPGPEGETRPRP